jgi:hypothetical protein
VGARDRDELHFFAIHVKGQLLAICLPGKSHSRHGHARRAIRLRVGVRQPEAQLLARDDRRAHLAEVFVAARVVAVQVGV